MARKRRRSSRVDFVETCGALATGAEFFLLKKKPLALRPYAANPKMNHEFALRPPLQGVRIENL